MSLDFDGLDNFMPSGVSKKEEDTDLADVVIQHLRYGNVFLTGQGGTGKSHLTREVIRKWYNPNIAVLGSTGIAAINVGGETVHSYFQLGLTKTIEELKAYDEYKFKQRSDPFGYLRYKLRQTSLIVIDEVSMLSADLIDMIYYRLEQFNVQGIPILFVGDFFQLPPVDRTNTRRVGKVKMAYESPFWNVTVLELTKIWRTDNYEFQKILGKVRLGVVDSEVREYLKNLSEKKLPENFKGTHLVATNKEVAKINKRELGKLDGKTYVSRMKVKVLDGERVTNNEIEIYRKLIKVSETLKFKVGSVVMFIVNDKELGVVNGDIGVIVSIGKDGIKIEKSRDKKIVVLNQKHSFVKNDFVAKGGALTMKPRFELSAYPIRIAFASTLHKSQGMSIDVLHVDSKRVFERAQFYVGISRARYPDTLWLTNFKYKHIMTNLDALKYYESANVKKIS